MLTRGILIAGLLAAAAMLTACASGAPPVTNPDNVSEQFTPEPAFPTPTAAPVTHSPATAKQSQDSVDRSSSVNGVSAEGAEAPGSSPSAAQVSTSTAMPTATPSTVASAEDSATIMRIVEAYWDAFNSYDADVAVSMLEDNYRASEEDLIRRDIGRMKLFRVKLEVSEGKPLALNEAGDYEIYLKLATPVDSRRLKMVFRRIQGQWLIVFSDEVE